MVRRLVLRQDGLQRFIGRDARQDLALQMPLLFLAVSGVFCQQRAPPSTRVKGGVQLPGLRGEALCGGFRKSDAR